MKRLVSIAAIVLLVGILLCGCSENDGFPKATTEFYVNDFANVIYDSAEAEMLSRAVTLEQQTTAQVVVATVEDLDGLEAWEYATELGRAWGIGDEETDNGVLILLSTGEREIFIAVGYGLEGALPDSKTGRIVDVYGLEYLKADDFSKGLLEIQKAVVGEVYLENGLEAPEGYVPIGMIPDSNSVTENAGGVGFSWLIFIVIFLIIFFLKPRGIFFFPMFFGGHRGGGFGGGSGGFGGGGFRGGGGSFGGGGAGRRF